MPTPLLGLKNDFATEVIPDSYLNDVADDLDAGWASYTNLDLSGGNHTLTATEYLARTVRGYNFSTPTTLTFPAVAGFPWLVFNDGTDTLTVIAAGGAGVDIPAGRTATVVCDGTDLRFADSQAGGAGGGESSAIRTITANATLTNDDATVLIDSTAAAVTATLPLTPISGQKHHVKWKAGGNTAVLDGNGANIDGVASITYATLGESFTVQWDGIDWNLL